MAQAQEGQGQGQGEEASPEEEMPQVECSGFFLHVV
jgi:hypothetical protein